MRGTAGAHVSNLYIYAIRVYGCTHEVHMYSDYTVHTHTLAYIRD